MSTTTETAPAPLLTEEQRHMERLSVMAHAYQMGMRILSNENITVKVEPVPTFPAAAWTDGINITLNACEICEVDAANVEKMRGVNLHEMAHVLFTPRLGTQLITYVLDHKLMRAFNVIEDQRIETFLTRLYPSTAPWLTTAIMRWVLQGGDASTAYLFVRGRKYLPGTIRGALRAAFARQDLLPRLDACVDEYRTLVFPMDYDRGEVLISEFAAIMELAEASAPEPPQGRPDPNGHDKRPQAPMDKGRPKGSTKQRNAAEKDDSREEDEVAPESKDEPKDQPEDEPKDQQDSEDSDSENPDDGDENNGDWDESDDDWDDDESDEDSDDESEDGDEGDESDEDGEESDEGDESDEDGDEGDDGTEGGTTGGGDRGEPSDSEGDGEESEESFDGSGTPGEGSGPTEDGQETNGGETPGTGAGVNGSDLSDTIADIAQEILDDVLANPDVQRDVQRTLKQIKASGGSDIIERGLWEPRAPLPVYTERLKGLRSTLQKLVMKAEPGWERRTGSGKLNASRWFRERDADTAFDLWDEGVNDAFDLEVVIGYDESSSMGGRVEAAANAMWVLKRSLDKIGASTTVFAFNSTSRILYHRKDKAEGQIRYSYRGGGTDPSGGLAQATRIFARSERKQKILVLFTDGEWFESDPLGEGHDGDWFIKRLRASGVITALGFIGSEGSRVDAHECQISAVVGVNTLVPFVANIVTTSINAKLQGR